jgi:hypothetical protein
MWGIVGVVKQGRKQRERGQRSKSVAGATRDQIASLLAT